MWPLWFAQLSAWIVAAWGVCGAILVAFWLLDAAITKAAREFEFYVAFLNWVRDVWSKRKQREAMR